MENYDNFADEILVEKYRSGEDGAFDELLKRYSKTIKGISRSFFLMDGGDGDDLLQVGFLGLLKAVKNFNGASSFNYFASRCIKNEILSAVTSSNSKKNQPLANYVSIYDSAFQRNASASVNPEDQLIIKESSAEMIDDIYKKLSVFEVEVFNLYFLEGLSYTEIGEKLQKKSKTIDNALQRIKNKIIKLIKNRG